MAERVSVRDGVFPIVLVAPHGPDDPGTDIIAEVCADQLDCYAVLNRGWERASQVDTTNDKANCNSIAHCHEDVVKDEFLDPLLRYLHRGTRTIYAAGPAGICPFLKKPLVITIHGAGSNAYALAKTTKLDFIIGSGAGTPSRPSCPDWKKNAIAYVFKNASFHVWEGKPGGTYAAWGKDNLNQLSRDNRYQGLADSIQIEITRKPWRENPEKTGKIMADCMKVLLKMPSFIQIPLDLGLSTV